LEQRKHSGADESYVASLYSKGFIKWLILPLVLNEIIYFIGNNLY
jgi:ferric iron reductase protein FhuF